jgi:N-acetylmuramoyl-L-alanine amidase
MTTRDTGRRVSAAGSALAALIAVAGCQSAAGSVVGAASSPPPPPLVSRTTAAAASGAPGSAPASPSAPDASDAALAGKVVVIDPGHDGGNETHTAAIDKLVPQGFGEEKACDTTGTNGPDGYTEHQFTFTVSLLVEKILQQHGIKVILTRTTDTGVGPCVNVRAAIGNDAHANAAVSIHADGHLGGGHGYQILEADHSVGGAANDARSHKLAEDMHTTFDGESGLTPSTYAGKDGYEPRDDIAGLNLSTVPKVLVECGNMREAGDLALEESPTGREHMAEAIADGIIDFLLGH